MEGGYCAQDQRQNHEYGAQGFEGLLKLGIEFGKFGFHGRWVNGCRLRSFAAVAPDGGAIVEREIPPIAGARAVANAAAR